MSRARADEEEYWHSSKFRAFTFDDEDDELSQVGAGVLRPGVRHLLGQAPAAVSQPRPRPWLCWGSVPCEWGGRFSPAPHEGY